MAFDVTSIEDVAADLKDVVGTGDVAKPKHAEGLLEPFERLQAKRYKTSLEAFDTFLPPRLVRAAKQGKSVVFFGAGVSAEAEVPLWWDLLAMLGISRDLVGEPELEHDPLTAAEVLAYQIGMPNLDEALRVSIRRAKSPAFAHFLLAALRQDVYITTNYDCLFEDAWKRLHGVDPRVVTTDADLAAIDAGTLWDKEDGRPILFKLHGSVDINNEELILTRSQYRRHYRTNRDMFESVRSCLDSSNTLFVGFGHRDPEITRLVEDVIHAYELRRDKPADRPAFYSLQFNMGERTPEIFAARGIVALRPPILSVPAPEEIDARTVSLSRSMIDVLGAVDSDAHRTLELDEDLSNSLERIESEIVSGIGVLTDLATVEGTGAIGEKELGEAGKKLGALAGQGVYLLNAADETTAAWIPSGLTTEARMTTNFRRRPYVKQARMYREPFVSTTVPSLFNGNATAFLCVPILEGAKQYHGLLFSAFQVGAWRTPLELQEEVREAHEGKDVSFLLLDANGVLLLPPNLEFEAKDAVVDGEDPGANVGFDFERLKRLSRRDRLVERVWNNIVPLSQDDDVLQAGDVEFYSVMAEVSKARWKLALSIPTACVGNPDD